MSPVNESFAPATAHARHSAATRGRIVAAAAHLMLRDGFAKTSISAIARDAQVAVQTVYNSIGSKRDILDAVLDRAASGPAAPRAVFDFMVERADAVATAAEMVVVLADWFAEVQPRIVPILRLIRDAASGDPEIARLEAERSSKRLANYARAARQLLVKPGARCLDDETVATIIWSIGHPQVFVQLVEVEGWTSNRYRAWIEQALHAALVDDTPSGAPEPSVSP